MPPHTADEPPAGRRRLPRRRLLEGLGAAAAAVAISPGASQGQAGEETISSADVAAATRLSGRSYTEAQREQIARRASRTRASLRSIRAADLPPGMEPATRFDPRPPLPAAGRRPAMPGGKGPAPSYSGKVEDLAFASAADLGRLLRARKVTSRNLTRMYLDRLKTYGPRLNCVVNLTEDLALEQAAMADRDLAAGRARSPIHGVPWGAKDLLATRGIPTTWGAKPYETQVFDYNATVVERLAQAGAVLVAKLSMGELAQGDVWFGGVTRNPWRPERGSSGSSAGPGSATAAGLVGFSIGTETLGSIVSPSVANGVTGLRPTFGRIPRTGAMALCWTMDKLGPMCRSVEDCALVLGALYGPDGQDPTAPDMPFQWDPRRSLSSIRVGVDQSAFDSLARDAARRPVYDAVLAEFRKLGMELKPVRLPAMRPAYGALASTIIDVESAASFARLTESGQLDLLVRQADGAWPNTFRTGSTIPAVDYLQAQRVRTELEREMAVVFKDVDVYLTVPFGGPSLQYTNLTGHPSLIVRCGQLNGLPQSLELIGGLYQEAALLRVGLEYERATPWHGQWPDTTKLPEMPPPMA